MSNIKELSGLLKEAGLRPFIHRSDCDTWASKPCDKNCGPTMEAAHYIIVREGMSPGVTTAQAVHAAGESSPGMGYLAPHTRAIVLTAKGSAELDALYANLRAAGFNPRLFQEDDPPYNGAPTALGVYVEDRSKIRELLAHLPVYRG